MSFWQNEKYEQVNKISEKGDYIRGLPAQKFPWLLQKTSSLDNHSDAWTVTVNCLSIEGNEMSLKLTAQIQLEAHCQLTRESLKDLGVECDRLFALELYGWNDFSEKVTITIQCPFEKIEEKAKELRILFFKKTKDKYTNEFKKKELLKNIKYCKISNFS